MSEFDKRRARLDELKPCPFCGSTLIDNVSAGFAGPTNRWHAGTPREHFDIAMSKRALAVAAGAIEVRMADVGRLVRAKRAAPPQAGEGGA